MLHLIEPSDTYTLENSPGWRIGPSQRPLTAQNSRITREKHPRPTIPASKWSYAYASDHAATQIFASVNVTATMYLTYRLTLRPVQASDDIRINTQYRWMYNCWEMPEIVGRIIFQCHFIHRKFRTYWNQIRSSAVNSRRLSTQIMQRPEHTPKFYPHLLPDHPPY
jgi:hypothetical protein